jgi:hypothetical protein
MTIKVSDGYMFTDYTVTINIAENKPPILNPNTLPANVGAGSSNNYGVPTPSDPEGDLI